MQFAIVNKERTVASPGQAGNCPACGGAMIAKCGTQRIHHWAHRGVRRCDSWWEAETAWHRAWKSRFPVEWREVVQYDQYGEKHIADVRTGHGLTIEFQHCHLKPEERAARENFYGNMVWVVDGARLTRDLPRFAEGASWFIRTARKGLYIVPFPDEVFPKNWLGCRVPVIIDFCNANGLSEETKCLTWPLWCLLPGRVRGHAAVLQLSREVFVSWAHAGARPIPAQAILQDVGRYLLEQKQLAEREALRATMLARQYHGWPRQGLRRRYARF